MWQIIPAARFAEYRDQWDKLNRECGNTALLDSIYVSNLLKFYGSGNEVLAIRQQGDAASTMAILHSPRRAVWESFHPAQAPIGLCLQSEGHEDELLADLLKSLPGFPLSLGILRQDPQMHPRPDSARIDTIQTISTSSLLIEGTFDDFWQKRESKFRKNTERRWRKAAEQFGDVRLQAIAMPEDVPSAIEQYGLLESAGWKGQNGTAISPDNLQGKFYRSVFEAFARIGQTRVYVLQFGEKTAAMRLTVERPGTLYTLKTTYDEELRSYGPGLLMNFALFKHLFDSTDISSVEFYGNMSEVHRKYGAISRDMYHMNFYRWSWIAKVVEKLKQGAAQEQPTS